eukprot:gb/GECG01005912.1/.p1 GENE.gb/GECG01005912.1/~~gb/GECG01005912.1/.p1  ORF type:complete len:158 (+),score=20.45 gb/GECG01005912.1/:1-474(+)
MSASQHRAHESAEKNEDYMSEDGCGQSRTQKGSSGQLDQSGTQSQNQAVLNTRFSTVPTVLQEYLEATQPADASRSLSLEEKYELYKERMNRQHPLYRTSNAEYGHAPKGVKWEVKPPKHTQSQEFSKNFPTGPYRYTGLNTSTPKSKFHSLYDGPL